jgi:hypothetical protein
LKGVKPIRNHPIINGEWLEYKMEVERMIDEGGGVYGDVDSIPGTFPESASRPKKNDK